MFLFDWLWSVFAFFGIVKRNARLLIIGLDNAGKSTLLDMISDGRLVQHSPTLQGRVKDLDLGKLRFTAYDLGGHPHVRRIWRDYYPAVDGIIFIVDAADDSRLDEARAEVDSLVKCEISADVPIAVMLNKTDLRTAAGEQHLVDRLGLNAYLTGKEQVPLGKLGRRPLHTFPTSLVKRTGYGEALRWLAYYIEQGDTKQTTES